MYPVSDKWPRAIRAGGRQWSSCAAYYNGSLVSGASDLPIVGGSVTDTGSPGVRRTLSLELAPVPGLFDLLQPIGTQLRPTATVRYSDGSTETVPMGIFEVDSESFSYGPEGSLSIQASDKWARIQRAEFVLPQPSSPGLRVTTQIANLIRGALGSSEIVVNNATSIEAVGSLVWDEDRAKAILDLAESIGAWVYFDRQGVATIADLPALGASGSVWSVDASAQGVLLSADRDRDRVKTRNVVIVTSDLVDGTAMFPPQVLWDQDNTSPTYAGTDPVNNPGSAGPFGVVPYRFSSPLLTTEGQARAAGRAILARTVGLNAQLTLTAVANRALDALDPIDVLLPKERYDIARPYERHLIDKIVHPLTVKSPQSIDTRATRSDAL